MTFSNNNAATLNQQQPQQPPQQQQQQQNQPFRNFTFQITTLDDKSPWQAAPQVQQQQQQQQPIATTSSSHQNVQQKQQLPSSSYTVSQNAPILPPVSNMSSSSSMATQQQQDLYQNSQQINALPVLQFPQNQQQSQTSNNNINSTSTGYQYNAQPSTFNNTNASFYSPTPTSSTYLPPINTTSNAPSQQHPQYPVVSSSSSSPSSSKSFSNYNDSTSLPFPSTSHSPSFQQPLRSLSQDYGHVKSSAEQGASPRTQYNNNPSNFNYYEPPTSSAASSPTLSVAGLLSNDSDPHPYNNTNNETKQGSLPNYNSNNNATTPSFPNNRRSFSSLSSIINPPIESSLSSSNPPATTIGGVSRTPISISQKQQQHATQMSFISLLNMSNPTATINHNNDSTNIPNINARITALDENGNPVNNTANNNNGYNNNNNNSGNSLLQYSLNNRSGSVSSVSSFSSDSSTSSLGVPNLLNYPTVQTTGTIQPINDNNNNEDENQKNGIKNNSRYINNNNNNNQNTQSNGIISSSSSTALVRDNNQFNDNFSLESLLGIQTCGGSLVTRAASPSFPMESYLDVRIPKSLRYLWAFYIESTSRFCAIHDFETPFRSSIIPMAANNEALQQSLMQLSGVYRNRILGYRDSNYDRTMIKLNVKSIHGLRNQLVVASVSQADALIGIATCLSLTCCAIGENNPVQYNVHLYGALMLVTQVLIPNDRFNLNISFDAWFLFKWTTYTLVLMNLNIIGSAKYLYKEAKGHDLKSMQALYQWWREHDSDDPEYELPVDSFYGFGTLLAPLILQFNILVYRKTMTDEYLRLKRKRRARTAAALSPNATTTNNQEEEKEEAEFINWFEKQDIQRVRQFEIDDLERKLWTVYDNSTFSKHTSVTSKQTEIDLLHCDNAFHSAALIWLYTYLKPGYDEDEEAIQESLAQEDDRQDIEENRATMQEISQRELDRQADRTLRQQHSDSWVSIQTVRIPSLISSIVEEVKAISPSSRTAAALLFVIYIVGSYAEGDDRQFFVSHLSNMKTTCLSSVASVLEAFDVIWKMRDQSKKQRVVHVKKNSRIARNQMMGQSPFSPSMFNNTRITEVEDGQQQDEAAAGGINQSPNNDNGEEYIEKVIEVPCDMVKCHNRVKELGINVCLY